MRSLLPKITACAAALFMVLLLTAPAASAQSAEYPPVGPGFPDCATLAGPSISIVGSDIRVDFPHGSLNCIIRVVIEVNPVVYDGPAPTNDILIVPLPALSSNESHRATVTATYSVGPQRGDFVDIPGSAFAGLGGADAAAGAGAAAGTASVPAAIAVGSASDLAFTGSSVNTPMAAAAALVGAGALTMLAARKREQNS